MAKALYVEIATLIQAIENCGKTGNAEWQQKHVYHVEALTSEYMPSGSGFDAGTSMTYSRLCCGAG